MNFELTMLFIDELNKNRLTNKYDIEKAKKDIEELEKVLEINLSYHEELRDYIYNGESREIIIKMYYTVNYCNYIYNHNYEHLQLGKKQIPLIKKKVTSLLTKYRHFFFKKYEAGLNIIEN
jgi:hypothetical protein